MLNSVRAFRYRINSQRMIQYYERWSDRWSYTIESSLLRCDKHPIFFGCCPVHRLLTTAAMLQGGLLTALLLLPPSLPALT